MPRQGGFVGVQGFSGSTRRMFPNRWAGRESTVSPRSDSARATAGQGQKGRVWQTDAGTLLQKPFPLIPW